MVRVFGRLLSSALFAVIIMLAVFAILSNFVIIAQSLFAPLNVVRGDSMSTAVNEYDAVFVSPVGGGGVEMGDIVVFNDPEARSSSIMHRVVGLEKGSDGAVYAVTKGDNNSEPDPFLVPTGKIQGRVSLVIPLGGLFLEFLQSPAGFIVCVVCPLVLLLLYFLARFYLDSPRAVQGLLSREIIPADRR